MSPFTVEPGEFTYRLVQGELEFDDYGQVFAHCRIDHGPWHLVPFTLLRPPDDHERPGVNSCDNVRHGSVDLGSVDGQSGTVGAVSLTSEQAQLAVSLIRGMAMDAPLAASSGHQGPRWRSLRSLTSSTAACFVTIRPIRVARP